LLHPPLLDECGLEPALQMYFRGINRREGLEVEFEMPRRLPRLSEEAELAIFRVVQASLTNIYLHSGSAKACVKIKYMPDGLVVTVRDHGRGIPRGVLARSSVGKGEGVGILGMKERIKQLGGRLEIETSRHGTQVKAMIPSRCLRKTESVAAAASG
jgi:signal transduction histidine kinase